MKIKVLLQFATIAVLAYSCKKSSNALNTADASVDSFFKHMPGVYLPNDMVVDAANNIYLAGETKLGGNDPWLVDMADAHLLGGVQGDGFLMKYNTQGKLAWAKLVGGNQEDKISSIAVDNAQNIYALGTFRDSTVIGGVKLTVQNPQYPNGILNDIDIFFAKYDKDGKQLWVKQIYGPSFENPSSVAVDNVNSKIYIAGTFYGSTYINDVLYTKPGSAFFIACYSFDGHLLWAKAYGDKPNNIYADHLKIFSDGTLLVGGAYSANQSIDGYQLSGSGQDTYLAKLDNTGRVTWVKTFGSSNSYASGLFIDNNDNFFLSVGFNGNFNIGGKSYSAPPSNSCSVLAQFSKAGDLALVTPALSATGSNSIQDFYYHDNKISVTGYYTNSGNFGDTTLNSSKGIMQGYVARYGVDGKLEHVENLGSTQGGYANKIYTADGHNFLFGQFYFSYLFQGASYTGAHDAFFLKYKAL